MCKNKRFYCMILTLLFMISLAVNPSYAISENNNEFKVIGYYSEIFDDPIEENVQFDKLTHIIYAFLIPREDGSLIEIEKPEKLKKLVKRGNKNNVKIIIAVGGWSYQNIPLAPNFEKMASTYESRKNFIDNLMKFVDEYNVDGVEIDWEHPTLGQSSQNYESLILEMSDRLKENGKSLTAALNGAWSSTEGPEASKAISDKCLERFDWISVMAYDMNNEQHSPFWFTNTSIQYWINRNVPKEKIAIGMPLYARPSWKQYRHLVAENRENAYQDYVKGDPLDSHYNGINTIKEKTRLALKTAGGVMLFDINEDTNDELSIVSAIDDTIKEFHSQTQEEINNKIYFTINGHELDFTKEDSMGIPFINENNRIMVPIRKPLEILNAEVGFDVKSNIAIAKKDNTIIEVPINEDYIKVNGEVVKMDTKAIIKDNRTYVPLRYVFEAFNYKLEWHGESNTVVIIK